MAIITMSEGITPVSMVILYPIIDINPITQIILTATTASEDITTLNDLKNRNMIKAAMSIDKTTKRKSSC